MIKHFGHCKFPTIIYQEFSGYITTQLFVSDTGASMYRSSPGGCTHDSGWLVDVYYLASSIHYNWLARPNQLDLSWLKFMCYTPDI